MKKIVLILVLIASFVNAEVLAKISKISVHCEYVEEYKKILEEESLKSVKLEAGVLLLYPMIHEQNPCEFSIVEVYADEKSYQSHLQSEHFKAYKQGTLHMVKSLEFIPMKALNEGLKLEK